MRCFAARAAAAALVVVMVLCAADARAIETTYGEDPVPTTYRSLQPPYTAYGMDPIPVESPLERWLKFKYYREQNQMLRARRPSYPTTERWHLFDRWR